MYSYNRRRKVAFSSLSEADESDVDDGLKAAQGLISEFRRYIKKCGPLVSIYKQVALGLSTPAIAKAGLAIRERANDMYEALQIVDKGLPLFKQFEKEFDDFCEQMGRGTWTEPNRGLIEMIQDLPSAKGLFKAGKALGKVLDKVSEEDEDRFLWGLDDYVGSEAAVYETLEEHPDTLDSEVSLSNPFFEVINYYSDANHIQKMIDIYKN